MLDTLTLAREIHPGQRNSLDALCKRYEVDASKRDVHGALIDSELLAKVYLAMTGGQAALLLDDDSAKDEHAAIDHTANSAASGQTKTGGVETDLAVIKASAAEMAAHEAMLEKIRESGACLWDFD